jgi:LPS-assembly lipoprotein
VTTLKIKPAGFKYLMISLFMVSQLVLSGCGFHLRGAVNLPYKTMYLNGSMTQELRLYLANYLKTAVNTQVVPNALDAQLIVNINENVGKQILSYNSAGQITAYRIVESVNFSATNAQGEELISPANLFITRDMDFSLSTPTASGELEALLVTDMRQDMVAQIARRIASLGQKTLRMDAVPSASSVAPK